MDWTNDAKQASRWTATEGTYTATVWCCPWGWMWKVDDGHSRTSYAEGTLRGAQEAAENEIRRRRAG